MLMNRIVQIALGIENGDHFVVTDGEKDYECMLQEEGISVKKGGVYIHDYQGYIGDMIASGKLKKKES